jgi:hypothetical protein
LGSQEGDDFLVCLFIEKVIDKHELNDYMEALTKVNNALKPLGWRHDLLSP